MYGERTVRCNSGNSFGNRKPAVSSGFSEADDGTRTHDLLHGKANRAVCASNASPAKSSPEQGFLGSPACGLLRSKKAFCASAVRQMYGGVVARFANGQRELHLGCICVSARLPVRAKRRRDAERGEAHSRPGGLLRAAGRSRSGRLLRGSGRVAGDLGRKRIGRAGAGRPGRRRGSGDAAARRQPGRRRAAARSGA